jgi:hypothetical protein
MFVEWYAAATAAIVKWWKRRKPGKKGGHPATDPTPTPDTPSPQPASTRVTVAGRRFARNGSLFVPIVDTAWMVRNLNADDLAWYLDARRGQGFNAIQFGDDGEAVNADGAIVLGMAGNLLRVLDAIAARGMVAFVGCGIHRYVDGKPRAHVKADCEHAAGLSIARTFGAHPAVAAIYINGMDDGIPLERLLSLAHGVRDGAPDALIGWHPRHGAASYPAVIPGPVCSYCAAQSGHRDLGTGLPGRLISACPQGVPAFDMEPCYEGMLQYGSDHIINEDDVARAVRSAASAGAAGVTYGHSKLWAFAAGWRDAVSGAPGARAVVEIGRGIR